MILCKQCGCKEIEFTEVEFDYWQWFDTTENFYSPRGKCCDCCGKEFDDGEKVILTKSDM